MMVAPPRTPKWSGGRPGGNSAPATNSESWAEVDAAADKGAVGRILRREGLYSSHLTHWRKARDMAERAAFEPKKRGPKTPPKNPLQAEYDKLKRENVQLSKKLRKAELIIEFQKKSPRSWG